MQLSKIFIITIFAIIASACAGPSGLDLGLTSVRELSDIQLCELYKPGQLKSSRERRDVEYEITYRDISCAEVIYDEKGKVTKFEGSDDTSQAFTQPPIITPEPRTIIVDGEPVVDGELGEIMSWKCREYFGGDKVLVEVGRLHMTDSIRMRLQKRLKSRVDRINSGEFRSTAKDMEYIQFVEFIIEGKYEPAFILFDGGDKGVTTIYSRAGLDHRWDWVSGPGNYAFIINTSGKGMYYDFSTADQDGKKDQADDIFRCSQSP